MFDGSKRVWVRQPARTALNAGCEGVAAINTITSVMGINLETLRPEPCVEGYAYFFLTIFLLKLTLGVQST